MINEYEKLRKND